MAIFNNPKQKMLLMSAKDVYRQNSELKKIRSLDLSESSIT